MGSPFPQQNFEIKRIGKGERGEGKGGETLRRALKESSSFRVPGF
jgi:hypothetical protein